MESVIALGGKEQQCNVGDHLDLDESGRAQGSALHDDFAQDSSGQADAEQGQRVLGSLHRAQYELLNGLLTVRHDHTGEGKPET